MKKKLPTPGSHTAHILVKLQFQSQTEHQDSKDDTSELNHFNSRLLQKSRQLTEIDGIPTKLKMDFSVKNSIVHTTSSST